jgi:nitroimidazol reductase NimA-like FMN-containing flavoprotein (pyridoxamine 5'-phosphate oxidase superfamily)
MPRRDVSMTAEEIAAFLTPARAGVLATIGRDAWPHLSAMWFVPGPREIRMWTYGKSQKAVNARRDPKGSLLVEEGDRYNSLKGVSIRGSLQVIDDYERVRAIGLELYSRYTEPHLGIAAEEGPIVEIESQARKRVGLILEMSTVASWDHSKLS